MDPSFVFFLTVLVLVVSAVFRCLLASVWQWAVPSVRVKKDYTYQPTVSILLPCYNEGQVVYETIQSISKSDYPNDKFEVIAQDDGSVDDSYEWMLKAQRDFTNIRVRVNRNANNMGK